jgi:hypothetical protein
MKENLLILVLGGLLAVAPALAAESEDHTDSKTYWEGNTINNLGRLGQPFEGFEVQGQKRRPDGKSPDEYLQTIRKQMANQAAAGKTEAILNYKPGDIAHALTTTHKDNGTVVLTLQVASLFDENASGLKSGAIDVLDHLAQILSSTSGGPPRELVLVDGVDPTPQAESLDAERCQFVLAYLTFPRDTE